MHINYDHQEQNSSMVFLILITTNTTYGGTADLNQHIVCLKT